MRQLFQKSKNLNFLGSCFKSIKHNKFILHKGNTQIVYLKNVVTSPNIEIGDYTMYNDYVHDQRELNKNNVLYHYLINGDKLKCWD